MITILPFMFAINTLALIHLGSISSTFYEQLLGMQIPKAQKIQSSCQVFFALSESAPAKSAH